MSLAPTDGVLDEQAARHLVTRINDTVSNLTFLVNRLYAGHGEVAS